MKQKIILIVGVLALSTHLIFCQKYPQFEPMKKALNSMKSVSFDVINQDGIPYDTINFRKCKTNCKYLSAGNELPWYQTMSKDDEMYFDGVVLLRIDSSSNTVEIDSVSSLYFGTTSFIRTSEFSYVLHLLNYIDTTKTKVLVNKISSNNKEIMYSIRFPELKQLFYLNNTLYASVSEDKSKNEDVTYEIVFSKTTSIPVKITMITNFQMSISEIYNVKLNELNKTDIVMPNISKDSKIINHVADNKFENSK